jgi:hypothetical protein
MVMKVFCWIVALWMLFITVCFLLDLDPSEVLGGCHERIPFEVGGESFGVGGTYKGRRIDCESGEIL